MVTSSSKSSVVMFTDLAPSGAFCSPHVFGDSRGLDSSQDRIIGVVQNRVGLYPFSPGIQSLSGRSISVGPLTQVSPLPAQAQPVVGSSKLSREEIYERIGKVICQVESTQGTATGIFIGKRLVAVPEHILHFEQINDKESKVTSILCFHEGNLYEAEYCYEYPFNTVEGIDCAIFQITDPDFADKPGLRCYLDDLKPGRKVYFGGFPLTQTDPTFHRGIVSSFHKASTDKDITYFTIDGTVVPGNSGGPVFVCDKGELLLAGMVSRQVADLNPEFVRAKDRIIEGLERGGISVSGVSLNRVLSSVVTTVFDNLSTGIGSAVHARHLNSLLRQEAVTYDPQAIKGIPVKHGTLSIQTISKERLAQSVKKALYKQIIFFFFSILKSSERKKDFYSKLSGQIGTAYQFGTWRLDRQASLADSSSNLQVQVGNQTVATLLIDQRLLGFRSEEEHRIFEVANYVAFQFTHAIKHLEKPCSPTCGQPCRTHPETVVLRVNPR